MRREEDGRQIRPVGIIALDLDGTLLDSNKNLSERNRAALEKAAAAGYEIVPTTGRLFHGMPEEIRSLPFLRYAITINGAQVENVTTGQVLYRAEIPWKQAIDIMQWLETYPVIYDCYMDNRGWMTIAMLDQVDEVVEDIHYRKLIHDLRIPVEELKDFLAQRQQDVQKIQFFVTRPELKPEMIGKLPQVFEGIVASSAISQNVEVNQSRANKGDALLALADHLGVPHEKTFAFGDGLNDLTMIEKAGVGIAMANAFPEAREVADWITASCDEDGVAVGIEKFCF